MSEQEVINSIMGGHSSMMSVISARARGLQIVHKLWQTKDLKTAVEHALNTGDQALLADLLTIINLRPWVLPNGLTLLDMNRNLYMKGQVFFLAWLDMNGNMYSQLHTWYLKQPSIPLFLVRATLSYLVCMLAWLVNIIEYLCIYFPDWKDLGNSCSLPIDMLTIYW